MHPLHGKFMEHAGEIRNERNSYNGYDGRNDTAMCVHNLAITAALKTHCPNLRVMKNR